MGSKCVYIKNLVFCILKFWREKCMSDQSSKGISGSVSEFIANFFKRIVEKGDQKLILGYSFINKTSDDFYLLQHWFLKIFLLHYQKVSKNLYFGGFQPFLAFFDGSTKKCQKIVTILKLYPKINFWPPFSTIRMKKN